MKVREWVVTKDFPDVSNQLLRNGLNGVPS